MRRSKGKKLMEGYVGVKFNAVCRAKGAPFKLADFYPVFKRVCRRLKANGMTCANAGNLSIRYQKGFIITSTGSNLGSLEKNELVYVEKCRVNDKMVFYCGPAKPSSETILHWLIYKHKPDVRAIIHAHNELATCSEILNGQIEESKCEKPYGTLELARMAIATFKRARQIIILKNHGYVAIGKTLDQACDLIINTVKEHYRAQGCS